MHKSAEKRNEELRKSVQQYSVEYSDQNKHFFLIFPHITYRQQKFRVRSERVSKFILLFNSFSEYLLSEIKR